MIHPLPFGDRRNNGVDQGLIDFFFNGQGMGATTCKVVKAPYKKMSKTFIGLSECLQPKEVIQVGNLGILYRIIGQATTMLPEGGFLFRIKRVDDALITALDLDSIVKGQKARITNRRSNRQRMQQLYDMINQDIQE